MKWVLIIALSAAIYAAVYMMKSSRENSLIQAGKAIKPSRGKELSGKRQKFSLQTLIMRQWFPKSAGWISRRLKQVFIRM